MKAKVKIRHQPTGRMQPPARDLELGRVMLKGRRLNAALFGAITDATLEETMDGASTLTFQVRDYQRNLLRSGLVKGRTTVDLDGVSFRLVKVEKGGDSIALTFEDTAVNVLRGQTGALKMARDQVTRAQFARILAREPKHWKIPFKSPEINIRQPVKGSQQGG